MGTTDAAFHTAPVAVSPIRSTLGTTTETETGDLFLPAATETYTHDQDGNLKQDGRWNLTWDAENRLIAAQTTPVAAANGAPNQLLTFAYDARGRRISKRLNTWENGAWVFTSEQRFLYDGWNLVAELDLTPGTRAVSS